MQRFHFHLSSVWEFVLGAGFLGEGPLANLASQGQVVVTAFSSVRQQSANPVGCGFIHLLKGLFALQAGAAESLEVLLMA